MRDMLWYAQLDVYDTVRRYLLLLSVWQDGCQGRERLFVSDFYLANPSLLHRTRMTQHARREFGQLKLPKFEFIEYPPAPVLFERMSGVQMEALQNLIGRGLMDLAKLHDGTLTLSDLGRNAVARTSFATETEVIVARFLTTSFLEIGLEVGGLRSATGLRRIAV